MGKITVTPTAIPDVKIIDVTVFEDERGYFMETYNEKELREAGIIRFFPQDNQSSSHKGVLRGLHFQKEYPQAKIVRVTKGEVFDVAVDLREDSPTFGQWVGTVLSAENRRQLFIPENFAHGFYVLSDTAEFTYKCSDLYRPNDECGIRYDDPQIGIEWPIPEGTTPQVSEKDMKWGSFKDYQRSLHHGQ